MTLEEKIRDDLKVLTISEDLRSFIVGYCMGLVSREREQWGQNGIHQNSSEEIEVWKRENGL